MPWLAQATLTSASWLIKHWVITRQLFILLTSIDGQRMNKIHFSASATISKFYSGKFGVISHVQFSIEHDDVKQKLISPEQKRATSRISVFLPDGHYVQGMISASATKSKFYSFFTFTLFFFLLNSKVWNTWFNLMYFTAVMKSSIFLPNSVPLIESSCHSAILDGTARYCISFRG